MFFEVAFWQLQKEFEFVRVKNKFGEEGLRPELRTNILVNLWVKYLELILVVSVCSTLSSEYVSMIVCRSMSYLCFSAFSFAGCFFFEFDNVRQHLVLGVLVFFCALSGFEILSS